MRRFLVALAARAVWDYVNTPLHRPRPVTLLDEYVKWYDRVARQIVCFLDTMTYADPKHPHSS